MCTAEEGGRRLPWGGGASRSGPAHPPRPQSATPFMFPAALFFFTLMEEKKQKLLYHSDIEKVSHLLKTATDSKRPRGQSSLFTGIPNSLSCELQALLLLARQTPIPVLLCVQMGPPGQHPDPQAASGRNRLLALWPEHPTQSPAPREGAWHSPLGVATLDRAGAARHQGGSPQPCAQSPAMKEHGGPSPGQNGTARPASKLKPV